jgi:HNH endonuclease
MSKGIYPRQLKQGFIDDAGVGHIPLTRNMWALCDAHNFHWLSQFNWHAVLSPTGRWYASRNVRLPNDKRTRQEMHRLIMGNPKGLEIDHKNGDGLLNTEENLRVATRSQNGCNRGPQSNNTSGYKGVAWYSRYSMWLSFITINGKRKSLGYFDTPIHAAAVYNYAAKRLHGEFAVLNDLSQVTEAELEAA